MNNMYKTKRHCAQQYNEKITRFKKLSNITKNQ